MCREKKLEGECGDKKKIGAANGQANDLPCNVKFISGHKECVRSIIDFNKLKGTMKQLKQLAELIGKRRECERQISGSTKVMKELKELMGGADGKNTRNRNEGLSIILST